VSKAFGFESKLLCYILEDLIVKEADREDRIVVLLKEGRNTIVEILRS
jgi:hypothetical protein